VRQLLIAILLATGWADIALGAPEHPTLPQVIGPLPVTQSSYPFSAADHQQKPANLAASGYVETEYLIGGLARVFDWPQAMQSTVRAMGPYTTRILVRRPRDASHFSGTVIVEPLNPSDDIDLPIMWAESYRQLMRDGDAWVGVTIKPNTITALKKFDAVRYAAVALSNPRSTPACEDSRINPLSRPTTVADESGLAWDVLSQIGALLKSGAADNPIPWPVKRLYMTVSGSPATGLDGFAERG
jgi:hypothetical protein